MLSKFEVIMARLRDVRGRDEASAWGALAAELDDLRKDARIGLGDNDRLDRLYLAVQHHADATSLYRARTEKG